MSTVGVTAVSQIGIVSDPAWRRTKFKERNITGILMGVAVVMQWCCECPVRVSGLG